LGKDFLPMANLLKGGTLTDCGKKALGQTEVVVTKDPLSTCTDCPLLDQYRGRGAMTIRLEHEGKLYGLLSASIPRAFFADQEELLLLQDVARDIAFALHSIEREEGRKLAEEELKKHRNYLEELVAERTSELTKVNEQLKQDISERKRAEEILRTSQEYIRNVIDSSMDMIITFNKERNIVEFNKAAEETFGYGREEVIGKLVDILYADPQEGIAVHKTTVEQSQCVQEILNKRKNGEVFPSLLSASLLRDAHGEVMGVMGVSRDITQSKQAEEQIKASLKEKEALLGEVHHRVKNNLQIISSLLDMRVMRADNKEMINVFKDTCSKIHTMALIHEQLYRSEKFNEINIGVHIRELVNYLSQVYARRNVSITPHIEYSGVYLSITQAIPCALVINELISNAFKHAFKEGQKGTVQISLKKTDLDEISFQVKDDGIGIPKEIDIYTTNSLGFKLLRNTVQDQLMGRLSLQRGSGTTIVVEFKILKED